MSGVRRGKPARVVVVATLLALGLTKLVSAQERFGGLDGSTGTGTLRAIAADGRLDWNEPAKPTSVQDLRWIESTASESPATEANGLSIELRPTGRLIVSDVTLRDERLTWRDSAGRAVDLALESLASIRFAEKGRRSTPQQWTLPTPAPTQDRLVLRGESGVDIVDGLCTEISAEQVGFELDGKATKVPRARVAAIVFAQPAAKAGSRAAFLVDLTGAQRVPAGKLSLREGQLHLELPQGGSCDIPWSDVRRIEINSPRLVLLTDLKPNLFEHDPILGLPRVWRADRSVDGNLLTLRKRRFSSGIGVRAPTRLTYRLDGEYESFAATVGVDDETEGRGDCVCRIVGDQQTLWTQRVRGTDPPHAVRVPLKGVRQLELIVDVGADLDLGDHVDWADAQLLRPSLQP